jgi:hypothetical protein
VLGAGYWVLGIGDWGFGIGDWRLAISYRLFDENVKNQKNKLLRDEDNNHFSGK